MRPYKEAAHAKKLMEQEEEVYKKWQAHQSTIRAASEARNKNRLDQAQLLNFNTSGRHSPEELVFMNLCEVGAGGRGEKNAARFNNPI